MDGSSNTECDSDERVDLPSCCSKCSYERIVFKVETPYHDNDRILTPIISSQSGWQ